MERFTFFVNQSLFKMDTHSPVELKIQMVAIKTDRATQTVYADESHSFACILRLRNPTVFQLKHHLAKFQLIRDPSEQFLVSMNPLINLSNYLFKPLKSLGITNDSSVFLMDPLTFKLLKRSNLLTAKMDKSTEPIICDNNSDQPTGSSGSSSSVDCASLECNELLD